MRVKRPLLIRMIRKVTVGAKTAMSVSKPINDVQPTDSQPFVRWRAASVLLEAAVAQGAVAKEDDLRQALILDLF
jgi:hypothetical protein